MSIYSEDPKAESVSELFYKKTIYNNDSITLGYDNLVDFNFGEKLLYGRVTQLFVPMETMGAGANMKALPNKQAVEENAQVINFVADAFKGLSQEFERCAQTKKIDTTDPFLTTLKVYKSYEKPRVHYQTHQANYTNALKGAFKAKNVHLENFEQFIKELTAALEGAVGTTPFTYPAYIKSRRCPASVSGLAIEIANLDPNNDKEKMEKFVESNNWEFYLNACRSYGFMVDRHIPWRLVADIGSSPMIQYASAYGSNSTPKVLGTYYMPAYNSYYHTFKGQLLTIYNRIKPKYIRKTDECNGKTINITIRPADYTPAYLNLKFSEEFFLETYFKIRFMEEESQFSPEEKRLLVDDLLEINRTHSAMKAVAQFERILNKPFDYRGSLSYIIKRKKLLEATE